MKVSAQNVAREYDEIASAVERGETLEIAYEGRPTLLLVPAHKRYLPKRPRAELFGSWKGKAWISSDFNSPELNKEIEHEFLSGPLFPDGKK